MTIPTAIVTYTNVILLLSFLILAINGYRNGLFLQLLGLVNVFIKILLAMFGAPLFAFVFTVYRIDLGALNDSVLHTALSKQLNTVIWFVILYAVLTVAILILKPFIKGISKAPVIKTANRVAGLLFGVLKGAVLVVLAVILLSTPLFSNGRDVIDTSLLRHVDAKIPNVLTQLGDWSEASEALTNLISQKGLLETDKNAIIEWLETQKINLEDIGAIKEGLDQLNE
ncbi:MAG: CvpA family protein [Erysipelothrix sp.]|nr:CvpA family protein [Erysipelothrix sp.]